MSLQKACQLFGISRQAIYKRDKYAMRRAIQLAEVKELVIDCRREMPRLGTRKLYFLLGEEFKGRGIKLGRDYFFDFLRSEHLLIKPERSYRKTTNSKHWLHKYPNLIKQIKPVCPDQLWVSDITYIETEEKTGYLSLITDAYSRKIVGYNLHDSLHTDGVEKALRMAVRQRKGDQVIIHHSDRGLQYCSEQYQKVLRLNNIKSSMTDGYDCYQNALAERMNGILKNEFLIVKLKTLEIARKVVDQVIKIYNNKRPHTSLNYQVPERVHRQRSYFSPKAVESFLEKVEV